MNDLDRMKELIHTLNEAGKAYYQQNKEVMSNLEYDKMYDELLELEKKTNTVLSNSPTIHVGYELMTALEKEADRKSTRLNSSHVRTSRMPSSA